MVESVLCILRAEGTHGLVWAPLTQGIWIADDIAAVGVHAWEDLSLSLSNVTQNSHRGRV